MTEDLLYRECYNYSQKFIMQVHSATIHSRISIASSSINLFIVDLLDRTGRILQCAKIFLLADRLVDLVSQCSQSTTVIFLGGCLETADTVSMSKYIVSVIVRV
jgi:hypothetical protein